MCVCIYINTYICVCVYMYISGANTGQSGGWSLRLGYVSLGSQTPKLKKVKWKKIKFCQLL